MSVVSNMEPKPTGSRASTSQFGFVRYQGLATAIGVFVLLLIVVDLISAGSLGYFDISFLSSGGATLALAAVGATIVILSGGFDLSAGAVLSLVNVVLATMMDPADLNASVLQWTVIGIAIGMAVGAFNGFFIAFMRLQPIVVTLSTMFIIQGVTLLIQDKPGGFVSPALGEFYMGDLVTNLIPMSVALLVCVGIFWMWLKRTRLGTGIYAVGSDQNAAMATGLRVNWVRFSVYIIAGGFYGLGGVFISAQTGSGDPLVGNPMLLTIFAAVVVGGTRLGGGRGGPIGSIFGAYILMIVVNILLVLNVSAYYSSIAEGAILLLAVLAGSLSRDSELAYQIRSATTKIQAWRQGTLASQIGGGDKRLLMRERKGVERQSVERPSFWQRNNETLRYILPAYAAFVIVIVVTQFTLGNTIFNWTYWNSLAVLSSFLAVMALGQGAVILTGGLDLSVPWTIGFCGILLAGIVQGSDVALIYALPIVLGVAALIGLVNGLGVVCLGLSPVVVTLATNGMLQGAALIYSGGTPSGFSSPMLRWFMTSKVLGITPVVYFMFAFVAFAVVLLSRTSFGRRVYAIGNSMRAAQLSGVPVGKVLLGVYVLSAVCAGVVGILLTGFAGQASLGMGDDYLLPSIAVVVVGGALITGGRGHYVGMLGGALLLTSLQTLLAGTTLPHATRAIIYGVVVLGAVIALRDRHEQS